MMRLERIACMLRRPAYISGLWRMSTAGLIPETVFEITCVTTQKAYKLNLPGMGRFSYQCIPDDLFWGYSTEETPAGPVYMADMEKALLDYLYFRPVEMSHEHLAAELRLRAVEDFNPAKLLAYVDRFGSSRVQRMAIRCLDLIQIDAQGWRPLAPRPSSEALQ